MNAPTANGPANGLLAIDVGSSRVKLGWFPPAGECSSELKPSVLPIATPQLPQPEATLAVSHDNQANLWSEIGAWLQEFCPNAPPGYIASVHPAALAIVQEMFAHRLLPLTASNLPIEVRVDQPERVGIDRLLNAVAVNRLRQPERPAIIVDLGTANTIDLISPDGAFEGGAILPGISLAASALHTGTAALPQLTAETLDKPPAAIGKSTSAAISAGLYWGMIGAVRELVDRISQECATPPQLFLTGGGAPQLVAHLKEYHQQVRHIPDLVLTGIALVAEELS